MLSKSSHFFPICTLAQLFIRSRNLALFSILIFQIQAIRGQKQSNAVVIEGGYTFDLAANFRGGVEQGTAFLGNIDLTFDFDTAALGLGEGGHFFIYLLNNHGHSLSTLMGDFQVANNIEAEAHTRLYEIWYEKRYKSWSFLIGQHDLNSVFAIPENGLNFINSSFGIQPDLSTNFPASIFPLATLGVVVNWNLNKHIQFCHAVYDGDPGTENSNPNSLNWSLNKEEGALLINEVQFHIKRKNLTETVFKFGAWSHTQNQIINETLVHSSHGVYWISDHQLIKSEENNTSVSAFSQIGISLSSHNPVASYLGGGFWFKDISPKRVDDGFGIAIAHTSFSENYKDEFQAGYKGETAIEFSYQWMTKKKWNFQPSFQYLINPGTVSNLPNALLGLIRFNYSC